jgi:glycerophosphoryl diester phosphodiesterase
MNLDICVYNVEEENEAIRLTSIGVDAITTNSPMKIREAIIKNSVK